MDTCSAFIGQPYHLTESWNEWEGSIISVHECKYPSSSEYCFKQLADDEAFSPDEDYVEMKGIRLTGTPMYLDMQATTPIDPRVLDAMIPHMVDKYGNPHSRTHALGWEAEDSIEIARKQASQILIIHRTQPS